MPLARLVRGICIKTITFLYNFEDLITQPTTHYGKQKTESIKSGRAS